MKTFAPVVIFTYCRPNHLRNLLESLMYCKDFNKSPVIIYCDGPRTEKEADLVMSVRRLAESMLADKAEYHFSKVNLGLSASIITGVTEVIKRFGRAIVVEDDLEISPYFLKFMNKALDRYADDERVYQISGYIFDVPEFKTLQSALFLPFTVSWGWATWKRAWDQFDAEASGWEALRRHKMLRNRFNLDGNYDYATMLIRQMEGLRDSWAIRWYWTVFRANGLVLFPPFSIVKNKGFDGSGTHGYGLLRKFSKNYTKLPDSDILLPESVSLDAMMYSFAKKALQRQNGGRIASAVDFIKRIFKL